MKLSNLLPPETITIRLPGEAMERLKLIQGASKWKLEELAATLFARFLAEVDTEEITENPKQPRGKRGATPIVVNGVDAHDE